MICLFSGILCDDRFSFISNIIKPDGVEGEQAEPPSQ